jgi:predicted RNA-binding protein with PIN domain
MPIMVDGNNLLHRLPQGLRQRAELRRLTLELARREAIRITLVFDGPPPPGAPAREQLGKVTVVYSGAASADDTIVSTLPGGRRARTWEVVTADRRLASRVTAAGARVRNLSQWLHKLEAVARPADDISLSPAEVSEWEAYFATNRREPD